MANSSSNTDVLYAREITRIITQEEANYLRVANLILRTGPPVVRVLFDRELHPAALHVVLNQNKSKILARLKKERIINQNQWNLLFPIKGKASSTKFDLTLMICLIRHLTTIQISDRLPHSNDTNEGADLSRIKFYRNEIVHSDDGILSDTDFQSYWKDISQAIARLGGDSYKQVCNDLKVSKLDSTDGEILKEIRRVNINKDFMSRGLICKYIENIIVIRPCELLSSLGLNRAADIVISRHKLAY
ncbi:unnamed protein product [Mytilus coruscus]|uniref:DZIP3-like HEPN domain-containing protein n=1 Tax=Mytilus coruscus TaxID=42192 RepID=A0A6J8CFY4_MYTCO|nr:unnamed protein product [Mytilus coruscus]